MYLIINFKAHNVLFKILICSLTFVHKDKERCIHLNNQMQPQRGFLQKSFSKSLVEIFEKPLPELFFLGSAYKE